MKEFKIRASAAGKIMGVRGLGKTGETYCKDWLKEQLFQRRKEFSNKYTQKGLIVEDNSIDMIADQLGYGLLLKNERHFENDHFTGTPDIILPKLIIDAKSSWDCFTFPLFETHQGKNDYYWQAQVYMDLVGRDHYKVAYCLMDTPEHLILRAATYYSRDNGYDELDQDVYDQFVAKMTYPDIPASLRFKAFDIERNQADIDMIKGRVEMCREIVTKLNSAI